LIKISSVLYFYEIYYNSALILDAYENEIIKDVDVTAFRKIIKKSDHSYEDILEKSIKFLRLLNTGIVEEGKEYNDYKRVTYRAMAASFFENFEEGSKIRMINWIYTTEAK
jgi:hypothetical protein